MDAQRAARINAALTPRRRELFDLMRARVAQGTWEELEPDGRSLLTIRWRATRKVNPVYRIPELTWDELVFVRLVTTSDVSMGHCGGPRSGRRDSDLTLTKALAVVTDPVAALNLAPVPVLAWHLAWPGEMYEPLASGTRTEATPPSTELIAPGHAARHVGCDGAIELDKALNAVECRVCGRREIRGRDVLFHPYTIEIFETVPEVTR